MISGLDKVPNISKQLWISELLLAERIQIIAIYTEI